MCDGLPLSLMGFYTGFDPLGPVGKSTLSLFDISLFIYDEGGGLSNGTPLENPVSAVSSFFFCLHCGGRTAHWQSPTNYFLFQSSTLWSTPVFIVDTKSGRMNGKSSKNIKEIQLAGPTVVWNGREILLIWVPDGGLSMLRSSFKVHFLSLFFV